MSFGKWITRFKTSRALRRASLGLALSTGLTSAFQNCAGSMQSARYGLSVSSSSSTNGIPTIDQNIKVLGAVTTAAASSGSLVINGWACSPGRGGSATVTAELTGDQPQFLARATAVLPTGDGACGAGHGYELVVPAGVLRAGATLAITAHFSLLPGMVESLNPLASTPLTAGFIAMVTASTGGAQPTPISLVAMPTTTAPAPSPTPAPAPAPAPAPTPTPTPTPAPAPAPAPAPGPAPAPAPAPGPAPAPAPSTDFTTITIYQLQALGTPQSWLDTASANEMGMLSQRGSWQPIGYFIFYASASATRRGVFRCLTPSGAHFDSIDPACEGFITEGLLGYVEANPTGVDRAKVSRCAAPSGSARTMWANDCIDPGTAYQGPLGYINYGQ